MTNGGFNPEEFLPEDGEQVLVYAGRWPHGERGKFKVCTFRKGISQKERKELSSDNNDINVSVFGAEVLCRRSMIIRAEDEHDNNKKPYNWDWSPGQFFGQVVTRWWYLPIVELNK